MSLLTSTIPLPYRILAIVVAVIGLFVGGFSYGHHVASTAAALQAAKLEAKYQTEETNLLGLQITTNERIVTQVVTKTVTIHDQAQIIAQEIPALPDHNLLSDGWLRLHNYSATGDDAYATGTTDGATSTVDADSALQTVAANYAVCRANAEELKGLQDWVTNTLANVKQVNSKK